MGLQSPEGKFLYKKLQEAQGMNSDRGSGSPWAPCSFSALGCNFPLSFLVQSPFQLGTTAAKNKVVSVLLAEGTMAHSCHQWSHCSGNIAIEIFLNANELISVSMLIATQFLLFLKTGGLFFFLIEWIENISHEYINLEFQEPLVLFM